MFDMKRREFITLLGGAAAAWPLAARAQQPERMRRIGVLMPAPRDDPEGQACVAAFLQGFSAIGLDRRPQCADRLSLGQSRHRISSQDRGGIGRARAGRHPGRRHLDPAALHATTRTVPIVFANVVDPVGAGFVESLARPGGNTTGFTSFEYGMSGEMAGAAQGDRARRNAGGGLSRDPPPRPESASSAQSQAVAPSLGVELTPIDMRDAGEIERAVAAFARERTAA